MTRKSAVLSLCLGVSAWAAAGTAWAGPAVSTRIVAGPSLEQAPKYLDNIYDHF